MEQKIRDDMDNAVPVIPALYRRRTLQKAVEELESLWGYKCLQQLRSGSFGDIVKVYEKKTKEFKVAKVILASKVTYNETVITRSFQHENIMATEDILVTSDDSAVTLIMPLKFRAMDEIIVEQRFICYERNFSMIRTWISHVTRGLNYLHENGYCHLDLKLDNVLVGYDGTALICDFGFLHSASSFIPANQMGLPHFYRPPEFFLESGDNLSDDLALDGRSVDMWALGALAMESFAGKLLFHPESPWHWKGSFAVRHLDIDECFHQLVEDTFPTYSFEEEELDLALDFVKSLLRKEPEERMSATESLSHPFFKDADERVNLLDIFEEEELKPEFEMDSSVDTNCSSRAKLVSPSLVNSRRMLTYTIAAESTSGSSDPSNARDIAFYKELASIYTRFCDIRLPGTCHSIGDVQESSDKTDCEETNKTAKRDEGDVWVNDNYWICDSLESKGGDFLEAPRSSKYWPIKDETHACGNEKKKVSVRGFKGDGNRAQSLY